MKILLSAAVTAILFGVFFPQPGFGAIANVTVGSPTDRFNPTNITVNVGDSVIWTWAASDHSTTSGTNGNPGDDNGVPSGSWDSMVNNQPHSFTNTFNSAGVFSYYCTIHHSAGMTGQVFVASVSLPPLIAITNPLAGAVFAAPATVTIHAAVTNGSSAVTNVQFLVGTSILKNVTTVPFSATTNNLAAGGYTLTAIALDNNGLSATNKVAINVVTPVTVLLTNVFKLSGTNFEFSYPANTGLDYVVLRSTNLVTWVALATNLAASNPVVFKDINTTNSLNFYRVGLLPNP